MKCAVCQVSFPSLVVHRTDRVIRSRGVCEHSGEGPGAVRVCRLCHETIHKVMMSYPDSDEPQVSALRIVGERIIKALTKILT